MNELPVKTVNGATVYIKDIAQVRDGFSVQTNIVRVNGTRASLLTVLKSGKASTLDIVEGVKNALPRVLAGLPRALKVTPLFDQSLFVRAAIEGVVREAAIAAGLTALMILLFLGSWRSTLIVCTSIPLSIMTSIAVLGALGQTINVMTLGGLALAVGILVDDATVEIENIHRNLSMKKPIIPAILDGAQQIALPAFVSTLSICIVFVPVLLLTGPAKFLFTPLAMAVVFAMLMSYLLTRTLVPTMVHYMLPPEVKIYQHPEKAVAVAGESWIWRFHHRFEVVFENVRERYHGALAWTLHHRAWTGAILGLLCLCCLPLARVVGTDFFPYVDSGLMRLHVRTPPGTRIEVTEQIFADIDAEIRRQIPREELQTILDNIGLPNSGVNLAYGDTAIIGPSDGEILIALKGEQHHTLEYERQLRRVLREKFPEEEFTFQAANITSQILNFGIPTPIDVQVVGRDTDTNYRIAVDLAKRISGVPGAVDVNIRQEVAAPALRVNVDRTRAGQSGLTQRDVANSALISLSSSGQVAPNQWLNPITGVNYFVSVQTPQYRIDSFDALRRTPITSLSGANVAPQLLDNLVTTQRATSPTLVTHYEIQPVFDVYANVDRRDLGGVAGDVDKILDQVRQQLPRGTIVRMRGQVQTMRESFVRLGFGVLFAIVLVYLLMVVNFQSWLDPFIILMALPAAFAGILVMLFVTQTTLNVPSLMGAIMAIGVATANSILLVTFANDERATGKDAFDAALSAGYTRMRPVIMTALAMIIGMLPMALSLGEGGEQNAPLGRAVIGGLLFATFSTLFFVPVMYSLLRKKPPIDYDQQIDLEAHERFDPNAEGPASERA
jgi:multidrug efflux pump subunit AcrB